MRNAAAIAAGFAIWIASNMFFAIVSVFIWEHGPDRYASIALQSWIASTAALAVAVVAKGAIAPAYRDTAFIGMLGGLVLVWAASSMLSGVDVDFKAVALAAHAVAVVIAFRMAKRDAPASA